MTSSQNEYDINQYTDEELYNILGLNHPTDRELEAKIIMMMNKYSNIQNEDAYEIAIFYQNIYKHFFDITEEEEDEENEEGEPEEPTVEGFGDYEAQQYKKIANQPVATYFTNPPTGMVRNADGTSSFNPQFTVNTLFPTIDGSGSQQNYYQDKDGKITTTKPTELTTMADSFDIKQTQLFDYSKNPSGTNPLLKQTIKRIISIDSQFRNKQFQPLSTNYTFNLSEPLKDVVSLKLYSINIPYTWYTVSKAYGANLIYLKGNLPGINNGLHDYPITIPPGNYGPIDLQNAVNKSIQSLTQTYTDISFGQTAISYDSITTKMTFTVDIQKVYNESYYQIQFDNPSIARFLGYKSSIFTPNKIISATTTNSNTWNIDSSNNIITLYRYISNANSQKKSNYSFNIDSNSIIQSYNITINDYTTNKPLLGSQTFQYIIDSINYTLSKNTIFKNTSNILYDQINSKFNFTIDLDRNALNPKMSPNEKIAVILPNYINNGQNLWINDGINNSLFNFNNIVNDFSIIISDYSIILDQISVENTYLNFICNRPNYNKNSNNFIYDISSNGQLIRANYYSKINDIFNNKYNISSPYYIFENINTNINDKIVDNTENIHFNIKFKKTFTYRNYKLIIDYSRISQTSPQTLIKLNDTTNTSVFNNFFYMTNDTWYDLSTNNSISLTYNYDTTQISSLSINNFYYIYTIQPNTNSVITDISYDIYFKPSNNSYQYENLLTDFKNTENYYYVPAGTTYNNIISSNDTHYNTSYIDAKSTSNPQTSTSNIIYNLNVYFNIYNILTERDYSLDISSNSTILDSNPQSNNNNNINIILYYGLKSHYNIPDLSISTSNSTSYIDGSRNIISNSLNITSESSIIFKPIVDLMGIEGISSNTFTIKIPKGTYYIDSLTNYINSQIQTISNANSSIIGTFFSSQLIGNSLYNFIYTNINIIYTSKDYKLVFFDPYSFIKCVATANSITNATWDSTLGWTFGYRDFIDYEMTQSNLVATTDPNISYYLTSKNGNYKYINYTPSTNINKLETNTIVNITGDTSVSINTFNYFLIVLDDFIQNHLNDGLVTISKPETQLPTQSYASLANKVCDPNTGQIVSLSTTNIPGNNLTKQQLYALNAIQIANNINYNINYSKGPYVQDIFGIVPIKPPSAPGQTYVEFGGTLQNQERQYFGPVNIHRMAIQLVNDKGDIVDLNGADWSFSLVCEQLYNSTSGKS